MYYMDLNEGYKLKWLSASRPFVTDALCFNTLNALAT